MIKKQNEQNIVKATSIEKTMDKGIDLKIQGREGFGDLTAKQQAFVAAYLSNGFNATKAAIEAGYAPNSAHVEGSRLLRNPKVAAAMASAFQDRGIAPEAIQILLSRVAFDADVADFEPWITGDKTLEQLRAEGVDTRAVKSAAETPRGRRIELQDRLAALKELSRILGLVTRKDEHKFKIVLLRDDPELAEGAAKARRRVQELVREGEEERLGFALEQLSDEQLEVWATHINQELCRRRDDHSTEPAPRGLPLLEDSAVEGEGSRQ